LKFFRIPDNLRLSELRVEDLPTIIEVWPHRYPGCEPYVESVLRLNYGLGLYDKATGQLLAWVMRNEIGAVSFIQTIEAAKCKGYATLMLKILSKRLAAEDQDDVLAFVLQTNDVSNHLFQKNGFEIVGRCSWFGTKAKSRE
jgi:ribosomal protein S18 acetylase RimI-like enzyme